MLITFEKHIPLSIGSGLGAYTISTTSSSYIENPTPSYVRIDPSQFNAVTFYYEAVLKTSAATGYASLYSSGGSQVSGSEVTTTSTSPVRVRSGAITISSADYIDRIKNDGTNTTTFYGGRVIANQSSTVITNTETQVEVFDYTANTTTSATYVDPSSIGTAYFLYTAANWNGTLSIYHEATFKTSAATGYVALFTIGGSQVTSSEITTTSTSFTRVRSGAITLTDATTYKSQIKNDGTNTTTITSSRLVFQQSNNPSKSEAYLPLSIGLNVDTVTGGSYQDDLGRFYYDTTMWSLGSISWYAEYSYNSNDSSGQLDAYGIGSAAEVTGSNITTPVATQRTRSGSLTMPGSSQDITTRGKTTGTIYHAQSSLVAVMTWTNAYIKTLTDAITPTDSLSKMTTKVLLDSISFAEVLFRLLTKVVTDTVTIIDSYLFVGRLKPMTPLVDTLSLQEDYRMYLNNIYLRWTKLVKTISNWSKATKPPIQSGG